MCHTFSNHIAYCNCFIENHIVLSLSFQDFTFIKMVRVLSALALVCSAQAFLTPAPARVTRGRSMKMTTNFEVDLKKIVVVVVAYSKFMVSLSPLFLFLCDYLRADF